MRRKTKKAVTSSVILLGLLTMLFLLFYPKLKDRLLSRNSSTKSLKSIDWSRPSEILGAFINESLPNVTELKLSSTSTLPVSRDENPTQQITDKTEQVIRETVTNLLNTVKESVSNNVSLNQEKIVQDVTAKLLRQILSQMSGTSGTVDRAVYDACSNIVKATQGTCQSSP